MAVYPLINSPCPYKGRLSDIMQGDVCRMCQRQVHDLTEMSDRDRRAFLKACTGEVCVSYRVSAGTAVALGALAASALVSPPALAQTDPDYVREVVIVGGIKDVSEAVLVEVAEDESDQAIPELPVVFEPMAESDTTLADAKRDVHDET